MKIFLFLISLFCISCTNTMVSKFDKTHYAKSNLPFNNDKETPSKKYNLKSAYFKLNKDKFRIAICFQKNIINPHDDPFAVVSIISQEEKFIPTLDLFHNAVLLKDFESFKIRNNSYNIKNLDNTKIQIEKTKNAPIPSMTFSSNVRLPFKLIKANSSADTIDFVTILDSGVQADTILVNFWYPNCPPCLEEIPSLIKISELGIRILNICNLSDISTCNKVIKQYDMPGENYFNFEKSNTSNIQKYFDQNGFPTAVLIKKDGKVIGKTLGQINANNVNYAIDIIKSN